MSLDREKRRASYHAWIDAARVKAAKHAGRSGSVGFPGKQEQRRRRRRVNGAISIREKRSALITPAPRFPRKRYPRFVVIFITVLLPMFARLSLYPKHR